MPSPFEPLMARAYASLAAGRLAEAIALLSEVTARWPAHAGAHVLLGIACERQYRPEAAAAAYARALALMPGLLEPAMRLSNLLAGLDQRDAAVRLLHRAADAAEQGTPARLVRAAALGMEGRHLEAVRDLRGIIEHDPGNAEAWRLLGNALAIAGRIAEAEAALRQAMALDPDNGAILDDLSRHVTIREPDRPIVQRIRQLLAGDQLAPDHRMRLHFALGKCLDDLGAYAEAMHAFDAANAIRARLRPFDHAAHTALVDRLVATFTAATLARCADAGMAGERAVFIVGMPRSGTTLVEQILSSHPDVAAGGEMGFWGRRAPAWLAGTDPLADDSRLADLARDYRGELSAISPTAARVTDKNPLNFAWLGLIRLAMPDAYIVHCRRNAVDTCLSCFMTSFSGGNSFAASRADLVFYYRDYARLMSHWRSTIPARRFLEIDYEELVTAPEVTTRRLVAFCELPWHPDCLAPERNRRSVQTASVVQARRPIYTGSVARWRRYHPWLGALQDLLD